jgi:hypothetical protein
VDDVRFTNEAAMLQRLGFVLCRVITPRQERLERLEHRDGSVSTGDWEVHPSEKESTRISCQYAIDNSAADGGIGALRSLREIVRQEPDLEINISSDTSGVEQEMRKMKEHAVENEQTTVLTPEALFEDFFTSFHGTALERFNVEVVRTEDGKIEYLMNMTTEAV